MSRPTAALLSLALASLMYGATFVVVKEAIEILPPLSFVGWRFLVGAAALMVIARPSGRAIWRDGLMTGSLLGAGFIFQTVGLETTSASNSGLITGLYAVFTPFIAAAFRRRHPSLASAGGAILAFAGLGLLTAGDSISLERGDLLTLLCALAFAFHIVALARTAHRHPVIPFTAVQLLVTAVAALVLAAGIDGLRPPPAAVLPALALTGLAVSGAAVLIQVWAQTILGPTKTAVVLALEPAFAAATAAVVLGERLTERGWAGAALILGAIYAVVVFSPAGDDDLEAAEAVSAAH